MVNEHRLADIVASVADRPAAEVHKTASVVLLLLLKTIVGEYFIKNTLYKTYFSTINNKKNVNAPRQKPIVAHVF